MAAQSVETPPPSGSTCQYPRERIEPEQDLIVRYCFRDDRLSTIDRFPVTG